MNYVEYHVAQKADDMIQTLYTDYLKGVSTNSGAEILKTHNLQDSDLGKFDKQEVIKHDQKMLQKLSIAASTDISQWYYAEPCGPPYFE